MKREYVRQVVVYGDYFKEFRKTLNPVALKKMYQVLTYIMTEPVVPVKFLKAIRGRKGLFEIRAESEGNQYRVLCCFDEGKMIVLFNGFLKKTPKTPIDQLDMAERLMRLYFEEKNRINNEEQGTK